jgi:adenine-specific DNA-methyltransferase
MTRKQKLELTWIGKENRPKLEPRILLEESSKSYHAVHRITEHDLFDNRLICGDNLLALKALEQEFTGKIKCIYIDPPFNTQQAFEHYDDGVEHSLWLSLMRDRVEILRRLLRTDGSIWVHCDDNEQAYLKVMMDEVLGRDNFITAIIWQKVDSPNDNKVPLTPDHDYILVYSRTPEGTRFRQMPDPSLIDAYRGPDEQGRMFRDRLLKKNGKNSLRSDRPSMFFGIPGPNGEEVFPIHDDGREARWAMGKDTVFEFLREDKIIWKERERDGQTVWVPYTREYAPGKPSRPYPSIWTDVMTTRQSKAHLSSLFPGRTPFETPKPEQLLKRILDIATDEGDLVLDSFAGSGTTGSAAHKMGRKWILVELGEHCNTLIRPRLAKVIDGEDKGGITEATHWIGGGGFRYFRLAPSLLQQDKWGNWVISKEYNAAMLAEAVCKLEGFIYSPSDSVYWQHGKSTERDFIYVTTAHLGHEQLQQLNDEIGPDRSLLVLCTAFRGKADRYPNLTVKKIPKQVLSRCEWGHDDYSLRVENLPKASPKWGQQDLFEAEATV